MITFLENFLYNLRKFFSRGQKFFSEKEKFIFIFYTKNLKLYLKH